MKATKLMALPLAYCVALVLLANEAQAKAATEQMKDGVQSATDNVKDAADWTSDQVQAYLDKYQIVYDKHAPQETLLQTAQKYRDAALANAQYFINDKTNTVERVIQGLKIKLEKHYKLTANTVDVFTKDIEHELKQLELSGSLTQDKVKQSLDKLQSRAVKQKYVTAAQYKEIANDLSSSFAAPTWFQKYFGSVTRSKHFSDDSFHTWITSSVTQRLQENKDLTKDQINSVVDTLQHAISSTSASVQDLSKLGTAVWWTQLAKDLEKNAKLKQNQGNEVIDSLKDEVNAYKIFAIDYAGEKTDQGQRYFAAATNYLKDSYYAAFPPKQTDYLSSVSSAAASATDAAASSASSIYAAAGNAASSATDAAASSASVLRSQASQSVNNARDSFGSFWRQKELETYRKVGYTEAHIDWMENYLSKTFTDKKNLAKETVHQALRTIRQYLVQAKVQTAAHIDQQLKSLEGLIESWRKTATRDEL